jgi:hypothetical protein
LVRDRKHHHNPIVSVSWQNGLKSRAVSDAQINPISQVRLSLIYGFDRVQRWAQLINCAVQIVEEQTDLRLRLQT